jgi:hypothetical protein
LRDFHKFRRLELPRLQNSKERIEHLQKYFFSQSAFKNCVVFFLFCKYVQSDQKENTSEEALQIMGHVVAESHANKRSMHGRRQFVAQTH